jgi:hypothetical protein
MRYRAAAPHEEAQGGEVFGFQVRAGGQFVCDRTRHRPDRHTVSAYMVQGLVEPEPAGQGEFGADAQCGRTQGCAEDMAQRQRDVQPVVGAQCQMSA